MIACQFVELTSFLKKASQSLRAFPILLESVVANRRCYDVGCVENISHIRAALCEPRCKITKNFINMQLLEGTAIYSSLQLISLKNAIKLFQIAVAYHVQTVIKSEYPWRAGGYLKAYDILVVDAKEHLCQSTK